MAEETKAAAEAKQKYTVQAFLTDAAYRQYRDLLSVLLDKDILYSVEDVDKMLSAELKREVR